MLIELLRTMTEGQTYSHADLARRLRVSVGLVKQMLRDLARMGYIAPVGGACNTNQCHRCPLGESCVTDARDNVWVLTAKGV